MVAWLRTSDDVALPELHREAVEAFSGCYTFCKWLRSLQVLQNLDYVSLSVLAAEEIAHQLGRTLITIVGVLQKLKRKWLGRPDSACAVQREEPQRVRGLRTEAKKRLKNTSRASHSNFQKILSCRGNPRAPEFPFLSLGPVQRLAFLHQWTLNGPLRIWCLTLTNNWRHLARNIRGTMFMCSFVHSHQ